MNGFPTIMPPGVEHLPESLREDARAFLDRDQVELVLRFATTPPLDFAANPAVAVADVDPVTADAVREMEALWEEGWGTPLAAAV